MGRTGKQKEQTRCSFNYDNVIGYDKFKSVKAGEPGAIKKQVAILNELDKLNKGKDENGADNQAKFLRLEIDIIKKIVPDVVDKDYMSEVAAKKLRNFLSGIIKVMLKHKSMSIDAEDFVETVDTIIDDVFIKVITEYDPIYMMSMSPPLTIATFCEYNRKSALSNIKASSSGNSVQNYKVDQRVKRAIKSLEARGIKKPGLIDIQKEIERSRRERNNQSFIDDDNISANLSVEIIQRSLERITFYESQSSIYEDDSITTNIEAKVDDAASIDFVTPEKAVMNNETSQYLIDALHSIDDEEGVKMYLLMNNLTECDGQLLEVPGNKVREIAEKFNTSVNEVKRKTKSVQMVLTKIIRSYSGKDADMSPIDKILSKTEIPFVKRGQEMQDVEEDFMSIIEINDF